MILISGQITRDADYDFVYRSLGVVKCEIFEMRSFKMSQIRSETRQKRENFEIIVL